MYDGKKVKEIRTALGYSQNEFSQVYKIPVGTLRNWEQGRRGLGESSVTLMYMIENYPVLVAMMVARRPVIT